METGKAPGNGQSKGAAGAQDIASVFLKESGKRALWRDGDTIVVAVSGGPDSMALLHLLHAVSSERRLRLVAAHVNHGFRGEESERELQTVVRFAESMEIPCETVTLDMPAYLEKNRLNLQAAAREKRYAFLHETAVRHGASVIALAHHADDQAETVLMRLIRGAGLGGLSGMSDKRAEKNMELIRPLLRMNKSDLLRYCEDYDIPYMVDSSNAKRDYFRNQVRLDVLPYLEQYNPRLSSSLQRLAEVAGAEDDYMELQTESLLESIVSRRHGQLEVSCTDLTSLHVALQRRLIKLILRYLLQENDYLSFEGIEKMRFAAMPESPSTWRMDIGANLVCVREYGKMRWFRERSAAEMPAPGAGGYAYKVAPELQALEIEPSGWSFTFHWSAEPEAGDAQTAGYLACFDCSQLELPLVIRSRLPGDRIQVLGLNGSKKVQDMFVDEKVPPSCRALYPLLCDAGGRLLWIPGIRRSSHALAVKDGRELLYITARNE
ncbi:tRNA lysidine(34) synthetase TilS [Paenibacillus sp. CAU 1782]